MNAKISEFVICVEAIIYLLLYNLHDCTFKHVIVCYIIFGTVSGRIEVNYFHHIGLIRKANFGHNP